MNKNRKKFESLKKDIDTLIDGYPSNDGDIFLNNDDYQLFYDNTDSTLRDYWKYFIEYRGRIIRPMQKRKTWHDKYLSDSQC